VPLPASEDPDPLLEFSSETVADPSAPAPLEPEVQPVAASAVPAPAPPAVPPPQAFFDRIERLERALGDSNKQVTSLQSEVATLVHAIGDIRKQIGRPRSALAAPSARPRTPLLMHRTTAIAGLIIGLCIGIFGWRYFSGESDVAMAPPATAAPVSAQALVAAPAVILASASTQQAPQESVPAPRPPKAPRALQAPEAPQAHRYVGTLSIDADPGGEVFLNRKRAGVTPVRLTNLRAGSHLIWIERDGYRRFTRVVQVPADRVTRLSADLEPIAPR
jgi:hypothetical protein